MAEPLRLDLRSISKSRPGVEALSNMSLSFRTGAVHVFCGENGAGTSTLLKTINGVIQPDEGERMVVGSPAKARSLGVSMISQELNDISEMTVEAVGDIK